jgi:DNA-binding NarL/FixJ family response regulator
MSRRAETDEMTSVLVIDDHLVFAEAIASRLGAEPDVEIVGVATSLSAAFAGGACGDRRIDVLVIGELTERDRDALADRDVGAVVVISARDDPRVAIEAIRVGARAFVLKEGRFDDLMSAVRGAARGETWINPRVLTGVLGELLEVDAGRAELRERIASLTKREREVLQYLVDGRDRAEVASAMYMSLNTVRTHTHHVFRKLGVHSTVEAVALALRAGFVPRDA